MTNAGVSSAADAAGEEGEVSASSRRSEGDLRVSVEVDEDGGEGGGGGGGGSTEELVLMSAVEDPIARWATVEKGLRCGEATRFEEKLS